MYTSATSGISNTALRASTSKIVTGRDFSIGSGFSAKGFRHDAFADRMDPFLMVDHYTMTKPTFGAHPHAGLAAVSLIFEDSEGRFHNRDSLGNDFDLLPGDFYWLSAGSGVIHDEYPKANSRTHGLQLFVNLPNAKKNSAPSSTLVRSAHVPTFRNGQTRVRIVLGEYAGITGASIPDSDITILDAMLGENGSLTFSAKQYCQSWIYSVSGTLNVTVGDSPEVIRPHQAIAVADQEKEIHITNAQSAAAHVVVLSGKRLNEPFVQKGPLVQEDNEQMARAEARLARGDFGSL